MRISRSIFVIVFLLAVSTAYCQEQTAYSQKAHNEALRFMTKHGKRLADAVPCKVFSLSKSTNIQVFNAADNQGFVVVSGDERTAPVLGYTDKGSFDENNMPDGLRWLLESYAENAVPSVSSMSPARHSIAPLLTTTWNQGSPYNNLCPNFYNEDGTQGGHSATGCVGTAIAQVMGYYRWPSELKRSIVGYIQKYNTDAGEKNVRLNTIPTGSVIDWDNILDNYNGSENEAQQMAIAQLMYWVGMGCKTDFNASSSAGFPEGIKALVSSFDYDDGIHIENRGKYTIQGWHDLLYQEIATGHPIAFAGTNTGGAHAFVLDGYDADGLFHVNWGWGGMCNGYFRIDVLDPDDNSGIGASALPGGYNMGQDAIIGFQLPDPTTEAVNTAPQLTVNDWEVRSGNKFFANYVNWSGVDTTWDLGIAYIDSGGQMVIIVSSREQLGRNTFSSKEFTIRKMPQGSWHVVPVSKRSADSKWQMNVNPDINYVLVETDAEGNVVKMEIHPVVNLTMTSISFPGNYKTGDDQTVVANFKNDGEEYYHEVHLLAGISGSVPKDICRTAIAVAKDGETTVIMRFKPEQPGTWTILIATDGEGKNVIGRGEMEVTNEGIAVPNTLRYVSHTVTNKRNNDVLGNRIQGSVTVRNQGSELFAGNLKLWLFKQGDNGYFYGDQSIMANMQIEPGKTARADFSFERLETGATYAMSILYANGGDIQDGGLKAMGTVRQGIVYWNQSKTLLPLSSASSLTTPAGAVAIDFTGQAGTINSIRPNTNPNTLYIFGEDEKVPEGLEGCNVVRGNRAESIVLTDSMNFFTPTAFVAQQVSYTRLVQENRLETLALPFTPQLHNSSSPQLLMFAGESSEGDVLFDDAERIEAGQPCLVSFPTTGIQTFTATDAIIQSSLTPMTLTTDQFKMMGSTLFTGIPDSYVLNEEGTTFLPTSKSTRIAPFRAYFTSTTSVDQITVKGEATSITLIPIIQHPTPTTQNLYDLQGRKIVNSKLTRGIYIKNGKKIVIK